VWRREHDIAATAEPAAPGRERARPAAISRVGA